MPYKRISLIGRKHEHLTALEKKAIIQILNNGWLSGSTARKHFTLKKIGKDKFEVQILENYRNDYGARKQRVSKSTILAK